MRALVIGQENVSDVLVRLASAAEVARIVAAPHATLTPPVADRLPEDRFRAMLRALDASSEVYVRDVDGEFIPVGYLTDVRYGTREQIDITSMGDPGPRFMAGPIHVAFQGRSW